MLAERADASRLRSREPEVPTLYAKAPAARAQRAEPRPGQVVPWAAAMRYLPELEPQLKRRWRLASQLRERQLQAVRLAPLEHSPPEPE